MEKAYEFKPLNAKDVFLMVKLIKKFGLDNFKNVMNKEMIKPLIDIYRNKDRKNEDFIEVGVYALDFVQFLLEHIDDCENEIFALLSHASDLSEKEVEELPFNTFFEMLKDYFMKEEFMAFFKQAMALLNLEK